MWHLIRSITQGLVMLSTIHREKTILTPTRIMEYQCAICRLSYPSQVRRAEQMMVIGNGTR
jgi:hypothetical protein